MVEEGTYRNHLLMTFSLCTSQTPHPWACSRVFSDISHLLSREGGLVVPRQGLLEDSHLACPSICLAGGPWLPGLAFLLLFQVSPSEELELPSSLKLLPVLGPQQLPWLAASGLIAAAAAAFSGLLTSFTLGLIALGPASQARGGLGV